MMRTWKKTVVVAVIFLQINGASWYAMFLIAILRTKPCPPQTIAVFQIHNCWLLEQQTGLDTSKNAQVDIVF
jgi:hypothetical protein